MTKNKLVVVGLGYVGLPVACRFAEEGFIVTGIDILQNKVDIINNGDSPIEGDEPGLQELVNKVVASGALKASTDYDAIKEADYVLIVVETPFDLRSKEPYYSSLRAASKSVGSNLNKDTLVIVESTVAPGTTNKIVQPILEAESGLIAGKDFLLATAPERVMPGKLLSNLTNLDRTIGGIDEVSTKRAIDFYSNIVKGQLFPTNEVALMCEILGVDVYEVRDLVNRSPFRNMHLPGAGVGGHCLPKDSWLLAFGAKGKYTPRLLAIAREINDGMPRHVSQLCEVALQKAGRRMYGSKVTVLGLAYLENSDDTRNSPAFPLIKALEVVGALPVVHDPYVQESNGIKPLTDIETALKDSDCLVLVTAHDEYKDLDLDDIKKIMRTPVIVDGRNVFDKNECISKGFIYRGVGQ